MSFELINAQKTVNTVREKSNLRYEQFLQARMQKQQGGNIYTDAKAAEQKQVAPPQQTASAVSNTNEEEKQGLSFEAIA